MEETQVFGRNVGRFQVYHYTTGDLFVTSLDSGVTMRISPDRGNLTVTTQDGTLTPYAVNGLPAFVVRPAS